MKKVKSPKKVKIPKVVELRIRIAPVFPKPLDDGNWQFYCSFPRQGSPDVQIVAKTAEQAKELLEGYLYDELDGQDSLEDR